MLNKTSDSSLDNFDIKKNYIKLEKKHLIQKDYIKLI